MEKSERSVMPYTYYRHCKGKLYSTKDVTIDKLPDKYIYKDTLIANHSETLDKCIVIVIEVNKDDHIRTDYHPMIFKNGNIVPLKGRYVLYRAENEDKKLWLRPLDNFLDYAGKNNPMNQTYKFELLQQ